MISATPEYGLAAERAFLILLAPLQQATQVKYVLPLRLTAVEGYDVSAVRLLALLGGVGGEGEQTDGAAFYLPVLLWVERTRFILQVLLEQQESPLLVCHHFRVVVGFLELYLHVLALE